MKNRYQRVLKRVRNELKEKKKGNICGKGVESDFEPESTLSFSELMEDVVQIQSDVHYFPPPRIPIRVQSMVYEKEENISYFYISDPYEEAPREFSKNGRGHKDIKRLQQNTYPIVSTLDLHGEKADGLDELLTEFCHYVKSRGVCGRIIHGSGLGSKNSTPVLKNRVRTWLCEYPDVLAYTEEKNNDGSVLVLLTKNR